MEGYVDEYGQGRVKVGVLGRKMGIAVDAVIDTGVDGYLALIGTRMFSYLEIDFEEKNVRIK